LTIVQEAVARDRKLKIRYRKVSWDSAEKTGSERIVDPLGLVAKGSCWYLVASTARGLRTFRVSRIEEATMLEKPSERPAKFDLAAYWKSSTKEFQESWNRCQATLRLEPTAAKWVRMWRVVSKQENEVPDQEGWITIRVQFDSENEACFVVLGLGPRVDVVEPESLRNRVSQYVSEAAERLKKAQLTN
jgi:predicted DNA-binding transcriptional regulator YafY